MSTNHQEEGREMVKKTGKQQKPRFIFSVSFLEKEMRTFFITKAIF